MQSVSRKYYQPYHQPDCRVLHIMVMAEDRDELPLKPVLAGDQLMEAQTTPLQQILEEAEGTFRDEPGLMMGCGYHIKTGDALPIRSVLYAIKPKKETGGCQEGDLLLVGEGYHCAINKPVVVAHRASHKAGRIYSPLCGFQQA